ncbi:MAG TPA: hypothetical protein PK359_18055 [Burkholderiaceae bacterium]|nr:hypothetical protein [Burkholderiaceae bacterium]
MRRDAWRLQRESYPLKGECQPRYTDVDIWQHLNNAALISMHGEAMQQALRSVLGPESWRTGVPAPACAALATDFLAEGQYPGPLTWGARVMGWEAAGLRVASALFQNGRCIGLHEATVCGWEDGRPAGLGDEAATALRAADVPGADSAASPPTEQPRTASALTAFPWLTTLPARFADSDARRLASDQWLARCAEQVRVEFLDQVLSGRPRGVGGMMVAHVGLRWHRRVAPGAQAEAGCGVAHLGERSVALRTSIIDRDQCVATCESVMVSIDTTTRRSAALPEGIRDRLLPFRLQADKGPVTAG